jgi:hypothetical protein
MSLEPGPPVCDNPATDIFFKTSTGFVPDLTEIEACPGRVRVIVFRFEGIPSSPSVTLAVGQLYTKNTA